MSERFAGTEGLGGQGLNPELGNLMNEYLFMPGYSDLEQMKEAKNKIMNSCANSAAKAAVLGEIRRKLTGIEKENDLVNNTHRQQLEELEEDLMLIPEMNYRNIN